MQSEQATTDTTPPPKQKEIRITGVRKNHRDTLKNISSWVGVSLSDLMKQQFDEIIKKYPDHYRQPRPKD